MANNKFIRESLLSLGCKVKACKYQEQALSLLHERKQEFDIVLADVNIPYEMGFKFVEIVSSKMNIPIITMCSARDSEIIAAGMNSGACQVAVKPLGMNGVQRFLQCALEHKRRHHLGIGNSARNSEGLQGQENGSNQGRIEGTLYKDRLVWTKDIEELFIAAVQALGGKDIAVPKKIMELMNVPNLTRENIASHLQKYRLYSYPNYVGGKRKRKAAQAMQVNGIDEKAPVIAHPNRRILSFEPQEFAPNAQNGSMQKQFGQIERTLRCSPGMNTHSMKVNGITGNGNHQGAHFEQPKIAQFSVMPERDTWQQLFGSPNVQPYVPEPPAESVMMQGMAVSEVFRDNRGPSLPAQSSFELQVPTNGIRRQKTPTSLDAELESFLAMDSSDPNFVFFDEYPPQDLSIIYGGPSNGFHYNNYPVGQSEMGNDNLFALNDRITNDSATESINKGNPEDNYPPATRYPQNISAMGGIIDHSNSTRQQQQEQIGGSPLEQPGSFSGLGTSEPSTFGQRTSEPSIFGQVPRNGSVWFVPKSPGAK